MHCFVEHDLMEAIVLEPSMLASDTKRRYDANRQFVEQSLQSYNIPEQLRQLCDVEILSFGLAVSYHFE